MTGLQLMAVIENTPLDLKNNMRCAKKCSIHLEKCVGHILKPLDIV